MQEARAPSTRAAYTYRWRVFTGWCQAHQTDPFLASTQDILLFLQMQLEAGKSAVTLRGMLAAIKAVRIGEFAISEDGCSMISRYLTQLFQDEFIVAVMRRSWALNTLPCHL